MSRSTYQAALARVAGGIRRPVTARRCHAKEHLEANLDTSKANRPDVDVPPSVKTQCKRGGRRETVCPSYAYVEGEHSILCHFVLFCFKGKLQRTLPIVSIASRKLPHRAPLFARNSSMIRMPMLYPLCAESESERESISHHRTVPR